ncbi:MAG: hypothetical protein PHH54_06380 [Candidatus Nanoarchaeia archaeon]|nr:hypothetical protein [Candidatus Nanoarchaeia archaeon]MDD5741582.1 hypothetical protein [Candidatus Nanoarchaeia archaeon]
MKWIIYEENKAKYVLPICESCLDKKHVSYGDDHTLGETGRRDCKNLDEDWENQCLCTPDWAGLYEAIEKGIQKENIFNSKQDAETSKAKRLEDMGEGK